jgi:hypothetical protein
MSKSKVRPKLKAKPERAKVTAEESLKRAGSFAKRKESFIAAVRKNNA